LTGLAVLAIMTALVVALAGNGNETGDAAAPEEPATVETSVTEVAAPDQRPTSTTAPAPPVTTTTIGSSPSTTTTATTTPPPTTTTSTSPASPSSGYTRIPKPAAGPFMVAPGGALTKHLAADIATAFGLATAEVEAAIAEVALPTEADGHPEGWLAPGIYQPADDAGEIVQAMVDRRVEQLEARQIPRDQWYRLVTAASVIEKETYNQNEKPRVARVLTNRLAGGGPLQMDSTILYPVPEDRIFTTSDERASDQPYNSYRHNGLPPTPICSPDEASLDAFLAPPPGKWWFYVTVDLHSGDTRYAVTYEEHQANVELLRAWLKDHPTP
jgi:UPF0755 protein